METKKLREAAKKVLGRQGRAGALPGIAGGVALALGAVLILSGTFAPLRRAGAPVTAIFKDDALCVEATYGKEARIPADAELRAGLETPETDPDDYAQKMTAALATAGSGGGSGPAGVLCHVGFYQGEQEIEPAAPVDVAVRFLSDGPAAGELTRVVHLGKNGAEVLADTAADEAGFVHFTTDAFSSFVLIAQKTEPVSGWDAIKNAAGNEDGTIYQLTTDIEANSPCAVTGHLTIDLNGYTISSSGITYNSTASNGIQGYVMAVDGSLTIMDTSDGSGKFAISGGSPYGLVYVGTGGVLTLEGGIFEDGDGYHAVRVAGGTLIMNGGTIQNSGSTTDSGGGSPIYVNSGGDLEINGGTIKNNKAKTGGAIQFEGAGNFTMTAGEITGNTTTGNGGGLCFTNCTGKIAFTGGTISENKTGSEAHGGGIWFGNCSAITISESTKIEKNTASAGGGIRVEDSTMTIGANAEISGNTADSAAAFGGGNGIGGGLAAYQSQITIEGGTIRGNKATNGGGGIALRAGGADSDCTKNHVTLTAGSIADNVVTGGEWRYGGGVYLQDHTSFTMTGGKVSSNHGKGQGGGIATDYTGVDGECTGDMKVTINGGTISDNWSDLHEGGGIGMGSGTLVIEAKPGPVYITDNESRTTEHWGGGGIMISDKSNAVIIDALIEGNTAGGFGGGLGACSTGHVYYGVGVDEDNPSALAAIFGNTAQGKNLSGTASKKNADHNAYSNNVFMSNGYQDVYSALEAVISGAMLGGGDEAWTGSADGAPVTVGKDGFASASQMLGLTSNATVTDQENARAAAHVFITGNHSNTHGGGIMCNGSLAMGWNAEMDITPGLAIKGTKQYEVKGEKATSVPEFQFAISNTEPEWDETSGQWKAPDESGVFTTKNSVDGTFAFDLTFEQMPGLQKKTGEQIFYFWEVNENGNGVTYDPALYKVTVSVTSTTEEKTAAGATLTINTWSIVSGSAMVEKRASKTESYIPVTGFTQNTETNTNSTEPMHWTTRTVVTLDGTTFTNNYDGNAKLSIKKVGEDGEPLKDAKFTIYKKDDGGEEIPGWKDEGKWKKVSEYTTGEDGIIYADGENAASNLAPGTYRLVETEPPGSCKPLPGPVEFEIRGTDSHRMIYWPYNPQFYDYVTVADNGLTLQIKNTMAKAALRIVKYEKDYPERKLAGAEFELYSTKYDGDLIVEQDLLWTAVSDENGRLLWKKPESSEPGTPDLTLTAGTYYLIETKAPDGYLLLANPITVTVTNDEKVTMHSGEVDITEQAGEEVLTFLLPNTSGYKLPESGGPGTFTWLLGGLALALGSAAALLAKRRRAR